MKRTVVFALLALGALSALSLAKEEKKPSATVSPAGEFSSESTTTTSTSTTTTTTTTKAPTTKPATTTKAPTTKPTTTTKAPTTKPTTTTKAPTTKPTTTTKAPTTKPTTTTKAPTTKPTTTTKAPTTKPTTTTKAPTTTTPKPTPHPDLIRGNYSVKNDKNVPCLLANMALQIRLATPKANGTFTVQPKLTSAAGNCKDTTANLKLTFSQGYINFTFLKNTTDNKAYVNALSFKINYNFAKGGNDEFTADNKSVRLFPAKIGHSYSCRNDSVYMGNGLYLEVSQDQMQAFNLTKSNEFGLPDACPADQPDYRVAIAVGVTLLVLIIVVVVAYLLGRKKRSDGYQTL